MNYAEWLASLQQTAAAHELSYDAAAVRRLSPSVREAAEAELVRRVEAGDALAFETAGELGLMAAIPHLDVHKSGPNAWARGAAARALFSLRGDPLATAAEGDGVVRGLDAWALKTSDRPEAIPALFALLDDPGVHARVHSAEGLVAKLGLDALSEPRGSPLRRMMLAQCSQLETLWPPAAAELREALWAVYQGATVESAGLRHRPTDDPDVLGRFWEQCTGWKPYDVENIRAMSEHDRAFAETVLLSRLSSGDTNALPALAALGVPGWKAHVRAALPAIAKHARIVETYEAALAGAPG